MIKFNLSEDNQWLILAQFTEEVEKKQVELSLTKKIHNWYFHPLVKKRLWNGDICFVEKKGSFWRIPVGLWAEVLEIGKEYKYEFHIEGIEKLILSDLKLEDFQAWVDEFFDDADKKPRDYQVEAAWKIIKFRYSVSEIATSSGKTLISFMIFAFLKAKGYIKKFLMIVPSTNLVIQGTEDFDDYGIEKLGVKIQQIGGGNKLKEGCDVVIGTYQSLVKKEADYFEEFDAVFVDECLDPDSLVEMSDGTLKKISKVKIGDYVKTINDESGIKENNEVEYVYKNLNRGYQIYEIETESGKILRLTGNHKVKLTTGEWKKVEDLNLYDELIDI
jgi:hypothetical protein